MTDKSLKPRPEIAKMRRLDPVAAEAMDRALTDLAKLFTDDRERPPAELAELVIDGLLRRGWRPNTRSRP